VSLDGTTAHARRPWRISPGSTAAGVGSLSTGLILKSTIDWLPRGAEGDDSIREDVQTMPGRRKPKKQGTKRVRQQLGLPGEERRKSIVSAPVHDREGGGLKGHVQYIVETRRHEGSWRTIIQWVDHIGGGHYIDLPHEVCAKLFSQQTSIMDACKRTRAQAGAETRRLKASTTGKDKE